MKKLALAFPGGEVIDDPLGGKFNSVSDILSGLLPYVFILAGLILFLYLILAGFQLLTSGGDPKKLEGAKGKLTHAIAGFLIVFASYWLIQIAQIILGIDILG